VVSFISFKINKTLFLMFHHQDFTTTITFSWTQSINCIYHFFASWCILTLLLYFVFICFSIFLLVHSQTWIFNFLLCISLVMSSSWCLIVALLCRLSLTCSLCSIVLCKFRFSTSSFFWGLWHFKQLSFWVSFHFSLFCFTISLFFYHILCVESQNVCLQQLLLIVIATNVLRYIVSMLCYWITSYSNCSFPKFDLDKFLYWLFISHCVKTWI
jgi:hypothetical protein